ncbi:hypothetical protein ig2599ANME_2073 [groundwater metagenome]
MRKYFKWQEEVKEAVREHIKKAYDISRDSFYQESAYTNAFFGRLKGIAYDGIYGKVEFYPTIVADRGPKSAEKKWGADFAITAVIEQDKKRLKKAILGQAKKGNIDSFSYSKKRNLLEQIRKIKNVTSAPKVLEIPDFEGGIPMIRSGNSILNKEPPYIRMKFDDYIIGRVMICFEGDIRPEFVDAVRESRLSRLEIIAKSYEIHNESSER